MVVETTTNGGGTFATQGTFAATFATGDTLTAVANPDGSVDVWRTTAANVTTYLGHSPAAAAFGPGPVGSASSSWSQAPVDNFSGGNVP